MKPTPARRSPCPECLSHPCSTAICVSQQTRSQIYSISCTCARTHAFLLGAHRAATLTGHRPQQSTFPLTSLTATDKLPSSRTTGPCLGQHAHTDPLGVGVEVPGHWITTPGPFRLWKRAVQWVRFYWRHIQTSHPERQQQAGLK